MTYCKSCSAPIPRGQRGLCSMCMGDIDHGSDGYYRREVEDHERQQQEREPGE
ncbi:hypothetical protein LCGC14_1240150 [marine sediment metagenome]|uniref:Uncharacterized protein n=1 Tax=marine sediment metagenome TaxID=412755 RepID=A0A0F9L663_9ZZZZ